MSNFILKDGNIIFIKHKVTYNETGFMFCRTSSYKDEFVSRLSEKAISCAVTDYELPTNDIVSKCDGKKFGSYAEAQMFIDGTLPKTKEQILQETVDALVIASLGGGL